MKKILLVLAIFAGIVSTTPLAAQSLKFGVVGGLNLSKLNFDGGSDNLSSDNRYGWYIGPKLNLSLPLGFGVDVAAEYSQRRLNLSDDKSETFKSIEIPVNVRYNIGLGSVASVYVATGPQFGFNVGDTKWNIESAQETFKMEKMNTSWNIGAGVRVLSHVELGVSYNIAISKYAKSYGAEDYSFKANTFQVQAAYYF